MLNKVLEAIKNPERNEKVLSSYPFLLIEGFIFLICWIFSSSITSCVFTCLYSFAILFFTNNGLLFAPLIFYVLFSYSKMPYFNTIPIELIVELSFGLLGIIGMYVKQIIINRKLNFSFGSCGFSFILIAVLSFISSIYNQFANPTLTPQFFKTEFILYGYFVDFLVVIFILIYLVFVNTAKTDRYDLLYKTFYVWALIISIEVIIANFTKNNNSVLFYTDDLGWSNSKNVTSLAFEISLPFLCVIFNRNKKRIDALLLILFSIFVIFISNSRGGLITLILLSLLMCYLMFYKKGDIISSLSTSFLVFCMMVTFCLALVVYNDNLNKYFVEILKRGFNLTDRDLLWKFCIDKFYTSPAIGCSYTSLFELYQFYFAKPGSDIGIALAHNTWMTFLTSLGVIGIVLFVINSLELVFTTLNLKNKQTTLALIYFLCVGFIHGFIDNTFFSIIYMLPLIFVFAQKDEINILEYYKYKRVVKATI